jgi:hypothetical protein
VQAFGWKTLTIVSKRDVALKNDTCKAPSACSAYPVSGEYATLEHAIYSETG